MAAVLVPPTKSAHLTYVIYAHPTYEICPSDLQKMPIWPTKNAHPAYEKCPSNLQKVLICPTKLIGRLTSYNVLFLPATAL